VDDLIAQAVQTLTELGRMDDTYFFFTSDHGFQLGAPGKHPSRHCACPPHLAAVSS
jgi:arylsulfatase A-like enzyme